MMRPRDTVMFIGHPAVAVPALIIQGVVGVAYTCNEGIGMFPVCILALMVWVGNCCKEAARYRAWSREWNSLDPDYQPPKPILKAARGIVLLSLVGGIYWLVMNFNDEGSPARLITVLLPLAAIALVLLKMAFRRRAPRPVQPQNWVVSQAIQRPLPAPSIADAYARLPDYCQPHRPSETARKEHS